jgi:hypothetical protein
MNVIFFVSNKINRNNLLFLFSKFRAIFLWLYRAPNYVARALQPMTRIIPFSILLLDNFFRIGLDWILNSDWILNKPIDNNFGAVHKLRSHKKSIFGPPLVAI